MPRPWFFATSQCSTRIGRPSTGCGCSETSPPTNLVLLLGAGFLAWLVVAFVRQTLVALLLLIGLNAGYLAAVVWLYNAHNLFLLTLPVMAAFSLSGLFSLGYDFTLERLEKLRTRRTLTRWRTPGSRNCAGWCPASRRPR